MPKGSGLPSLNLGATGNGNDGTQALSPPMSPKSPTSMHSSISQPGSPRLADIQARSMFAHATNGIDTFSGSQGPPQSDPAQMESIPLSPPSPSNASPKHGRDPSKSFFSNLIASKSSHRLHSPDASTAESVERSTLKSRASSKERNARPLRSKGSTPELPRMLQSNGEAGHRNTTEDPQSQDLAAKRGKSKLGGILNRTKSIKLDDTPKFKARSPTHLKLEPAALQSPHTDERFSETIMTAPIRTEYREQAFGNDGGSSIRNRSVDRQMRSRGDDNTSFSKKERIAGSLAGPHSFRDGAGLLSGLQQTGKGMGDRLGRAGKGFLGKITRSGSTTERELVTDDTYVCTIINLPLVKQTRKTRIARRLELSKDKTEFWMPALPWRCIDYLNMNGCEEEGLYRIPGSNRDVKRWQRRFDTEVDINLFDEPELYDINTIGSMFKSWLRDLPDEILPKRTQAKIAAECAGSTKTPKLLKDELSKLPPFNYYLLFAITCHLSLLHSFSDKNKMDYRNLCICFQPCLKIDGFCFQFLVQDWKSCWQGCWTEKEYLEEEYRWEKEGSVDGAGSDDEHERAISSSGSSQHQHQQHQQRASSRDARPSSQRKASLPRTLRRKASSSASAGIASIQVNGHHVSTSEPVPAVPPMVKTPEPQVVNAERLPELKGLSPIKF